MSEDRDILNRFFVRTFNKILACEEHAIGEPDISVNEIHIIEATSELMKTGENTMKNIAASLSLSAGATSVAVNTLVNKGYLCRENGKEDRRKVFIFLTEKAKKPEEKHRVFHDHMIKAVENKLSSHEMSALSKSLATLEDFFAGIK